MADLFIFRFTLSLLSSLRESLFFLFRSSDSGDGISRRSVLSTRMLPFFNTGRDLALSQHSGKEASHAPKLSLFDLPENLRYLVCVQAQALTNELDRLVEFREVRAATVYRVGCEIANLSSICCLVRDTLEGRREWAVPAIGEIQDHSRALDLERDACPCCSAERLLDLDGEVMRSFHDGGEDASVATCTQEYALKALVDEAEKVLGSLDDYIVAEDEPEPLALLPASSFHRSLHAVGSKFRHLLRRVKVLRLVEWRKRLAKQRVTFQMVTQTVTITA